MQWSITGVVLEADGKPATGNIQVQIYDLGRKTWRVQVQGALNAQGRFALKTNLVPGGQALPAMRLCETSAAGQPARVLAEGGLVQVASATAIHLSFGQVQRLAGNAIARNDRTAPFGQADDYLVAGVPRAPAPTVTAATARMTMASAPIATVAMEQPSTVQLRMNADLTKRIEQQDTELNQKQIQVAKLEESNLKANQDLHMAQSKINILENQLKTQPAVAAATTTKPINEQFTIATETMRLNLNEQIIRQAADYDIRASNLQQTINAKNLELASYTERLQELSKVSSAAMEEAAKAKAEADQLKQQMNTQVGAGELYASIGKQLQEAQSALDSEAVPYRLGKVSLNLKTLVAGNQLTMPTLADLNNKGAAGMFTDVNIEFLPDSNEGTGEDLVNVPDFSDLTETLARRLARDMGLNMDAAYQSVTDPSQPIGQAIRQLPAKGTQVAPGESIMVVFTQA